MTAFVILAAGRGSRIGRVGESLHKSLVPLEGKAILSHLFDLAPADANVIICLGHRGDQIRDYVELAHPDKTVTFANVAGWDQPGGGPGRSLLAAMPYVGDEDLVFTSCDTLWESDPSLWEATSSWSGVAPMPVGTSPDRWCRISSHPSGRVVDILDKTTTFNDVTDAYVGLSFIKAMDLPLFIVGVTTGHYVQGEQQVTGGLETLTDAGRLCAQRVSWTDVGDADAYRRAVIERQGFDWTKEKEATWLLPESGRVVKFWDASSEADKHYGRHIAVGDGLPGLVAVRDHMLSYQYVPGQIGYNAVTNASQMSQLLEWAMQTVWRPVDVTPDEAMDAAKSFYYDKTMMRISMLSPELRAMTYDAVSRVDWDSVVGNVQPVRWHGDFNLGNIIYGDDGQFYGIDWRSDFAGRPWGDQRYDLAKLLVGCRINWDHARHGDFGPWPEGKVLETAIRGRINPSRDVEMIAALTLLNSAPLHATPLDEVLVIQAAKWLEGIE